MNSYLVDVPVALDVFARPDTLRLVFNSVKSARPSILFLISDGPRQNFPLDVVNIKKSREIVDDIDWECEVHRLYFEKNQGMYHKDKIAREYIFSRVDRCIFLEDDILVSVSFFRFCADLLEKYKDDLRVHYITGMNYLGIYDAPDSDYFFCGEGAIWGIATWKRTNEQFNHEYKNDKYAFDLIKKLADMNKNGYSKKIENCVKNGMYDGHIAGPEYFKNLIKYSQNQLFIVPKKNMVCYLGYTENSTHGPDSLNKIPRGLRKIYNMKTYEYDFPLKHPRYFVKDIIYENEVEKIIPYNNKFKKYMRKFESLILHLYFRDYKRICRKFFSIFRKQYEN
jgi:hypothetical protein